MTEQRKKEAYHSQQLPTPDDSRVFSNNESLNEEQADLFNSDNYFKEQTPKIIIPKDNMKSLFTKLASNGHLRTLKDKSINPDSLLLKEPSFASKDMKMFDSKLNIDEYIMNDPNLLLTDTFMNKVNSSSYSPNKKLDDLPLSNAIDSFKVQSNESITKNSSLDNSIHLPSYSTNAQFNPMDNARPLMTEASSNSNGKAINSQRKSALGNKQPTVNHKTLQSTRTPTKLSHTKNMTQNGKKNLPAVSKQTIPTSSSKKEITFNSINDTNSKNAMKRKTNSPSVQMMSSKKGGLKPTVSSSSNSNGNEMNIIEEYDYNKILLDLKAIFGDNLEYFDENLLFSNLDEATNKGLIKGLLMLSYFQEKKLKNMRETMNKAKTQFKEEISKKDNLIDEMSHDLSNINFNLKGRK